MSCWSFLKDWTQQRGAARTQEHGAVSVARTRSDTKTQTSVSWGAGGGLIYSVLAECRGRLRGTAAVAAAGTRYYWLGSTGWDQPIQSTSEPRPIGPPELQNPTALRLTSAKKRKKRTISHSPGKCFRKRKFEVLGWKKQISCRSELEYLLLSRHQPCCFDPELKYVDKQHK